MEAILMERLNQMADNIAHMRLAVDEMRSEVAQIGILEEKHSTATASIERAFAEIKRLDLALLDHAKDDGREHSKFNKAIWFSTGFALAVSVLWTIFGVYLADSLKDTVKGVAEMRYHMNDRSAHQPLERKQP